MKYLIKIGESEDTEEIDIPYVFLEEVYFVEQKRKKKCVVYRGEIESFWITNIYGVVVRDYHSFQEHYIDSSNFGIIFKNRDEAIKYCLEQNEKLSVKVYD